MGFAVETFSTETYETEAASYIAARLPRSGSVVITGGTTAAAVYGPLADAGGWSDLDVYFSDERCVPPDDKRSNFGMAKRVLLDRVRPRRIERMMGEEPPEIAAEAYHQRVADAMAAGLDLVLLGMGADAHVCALFPSSPALDVTSSYCAPVDRPDGLRGLTLTPPALRAATRVLLIVNGRSKAEAVTRVVKGDERPADCPARLLAGLDATFLLDGEAAARL
ncbi:MAG: 6-phosphogluconolactonase [Actinomycetota bacterium]